MSDHAKTPPISTPDEQWSMGMGQTPNGPIFVRKNMAAGALEKSGLPWCVRIIVELGDMTDNGLPTSGESKRLEDIEKSLWSFFEEDSGRRRGLLVMVITVPGMRDFVTYVCDEACGFELAQFVRERVLDRKTEVLAEKDEAWQAYSAMM